MISTDCLNNPNFTSTFVTELVISQCRNAVAAQSCKRAIESVKVRVVHVCIAGLIH